MAIEASARPTSGQVRLLASAGAGAESGETMAVITR